MRSLCGPDSSLMWSFPMKPIGLLDSKVGHASACPDEDNSHIRPGLPPGRQAKACPTLETISRRIPWLVVSLALVVTLAGCSNAHGDQAAEAPPAPNVVPAPDAALFSVDHPEQFPLAAASRHPTTSELIV